MNIIMTKNKLEYLIGGMIAVCAFVIYCLTLCPTVNFIDSGELATVAATLGIAHPTGYPLFTLFGWIFAHLPLGLRTIIQLNLMSAFFCSLGLFFFFRLSVFLIGEFLANKNRIEEKNAWQVFIGAAFGTLTLAFSETYWSQALSIEVYSLHVCFATVLLLLFTKCVQVEVLSRTKNSIKVASTTWFVVAFVLGLSFTNHLTTILLAPAFLYLFFYFHGFRQGTWKKILWMVFPFILGLSVYLYLPLSAAQHPLMNWGNPIDVEKFLWHFSGKVYRVWIFSSAENAVKQFDYFLNTIGSEFAYYPLVIALLGIGYLIKNRRKVFIFTALLFVSCVLYSINYDIHDIDSYFLLAYTTIAIWAGIGSYAIIAQVKKLEWKRIAAVLLLLSGLIIMFINYNRVDQSDNYLVEDYSMDMLGSIDKDGIIISYQWDYFISAAYYLQLIENRRPDVVVIDKELLRRSWYYNQLGDRHPEIFKNSKKEIANFLHELYRFEHDQPYNSNVIEYHYAQLIKSIVDNNYSTNPIYITQEIEDRYTPGYTRVPSGLAFRLYADTTAHHISKPVFNFRNPSIHNIYIDGIKSLYAQAYLNNAIYLNMLGEKDTALFYLDHAIQIQPHLKSALSMKAQLKK